MSQNKFFNEEMDRNEALSLRVGVSREPLEMGELLIEFLRSNEPLAIAIREWGCGSGNLNHNGNDNHNHNENENENENHNGDDNLQGGYTSLEDWLDGATTEDMLNISKRTLQHYRDSGMLCFSKVGHKIYYKRSDVEAMLEEHYQRACQARLKKGGAL